MKENGALERIVVGLDGSSSSLRALEWAMRLSRGSGAEIVAVHGFVPPPHVSPVFTADGKEGRRQAQVMFEYDWCAPLTQAKLPHRAVFTDGNPVSRLIAVAIEEEADLIVVGARGLGGFAELLLGSVSQQLAAHSPIPVVVVPSLSRPLPHEAEEAQKAAGRRLTFSEMP